MLSNKDKGTSVGFSKPFQERINYVVSEGYYIGSSVNMPLLVQAESFEEMRKGIRELGCHYLGTLTKQFMQEEPFEFVQVETFHKTN